MDRPSGRRTRPRGDAHLTAVESVAARWPVFVPAAVAAVMGVPQASGRPPVESLCAALARRQLLLVLDNCEHVLDACAELVVACAG